MIFLRSSFFIGLLQFTMLDCWDTKIRHHRKYDSIQESKVEHRPSRIKEQFNMAWSRRHKLDDEADKEIKSGPVFRSENNTVVRAHSGSRTSLPCQIYKDSHHGVITWGVLERPDKPYTLLTVGDSPYTDNLRFSIEKPIRHDQWNLLIKPVEVEDSGLYECQATTHPPQSIIVKLVVLEAYAEISGTKEKVFKSESKLQLVCALRKATSKPEYIFWYHNNRMINYDSESRISVVEDMNGSTLTIYSVSVSQSGNYTCQPSNMKPDSVVVTILAESKSANALQDKATGSSCHSSPLQLSIYMVAALLLKN